MSFRAEETTLLNKIYRPIVCVCLSVEHKISSLSSEGQGFVQDI